MRVAAISELDSLLEEVLTEQSQRDMIRDEISGEYSQVINYNGQAIDFLELKTHTDADGNPVDFYGKKGGTLDTYTRTSGGSSLSINVPGVILRTNSHILRTPAIITDALLGQGEALDCFNSQAQEAKKNKLILENAQLQLALETLDEIPDPVQRAEYFAKIFNPPTPVLPDLNLNAG